MRFFTPHQRLAIFAADEGRCGICGVPLQPGFHADHVTAAAHGGETDVINGAALCPRCNLMKGVAAAPHDRPAADPPPLPAWTRPLRPWQESGLVRWRRRRSDGGRDFLATACPAAGKTAFALRVIHDEISSGRVGRAIVVVPTLTLKGQWAAAAQAVGLRLCASWGSDAVAFPGDAHGLVLTYQQVCRLPEAVRVHTARHRILACLDEIHHGGGGLAWGDALSEAFEQAEARLCLSGTAWRSDQAPIPFTACDGAGNSASDLAYPYAEALADGVVRETFFFTQAGQVRWLDGTGEHTAGFQDDLDSQGKSRRLRAALDARGDWLAGVLRQAHATLGETLLTDPGAKAMVACMDGSHARAVAGLLGAITGERPVVALADDPASAGALAGFEAGTARWLVCVRMASEGFDAPRLRLIVWATNVVSELFFRQLTARAIRMVPGLKYQDAVVYLPADPRLLAMAQSLLAERVQALGGPQQDREARTPGAGPAVGPLFMPLESRAAAGAIVSGGATIPREALVTAAAFRAGKPALAHLPAHFIAAIFSHLEPHQVPQPPAADPAPAADVAAHPDGHEGVQAATYDDLRLRRRRTCSRLAAVLARASGTPVEAVHRACHQELGVRQGEASLVDLERKERLLIARLRDIGPA